MREQKFEDYFGRKIAIDASMHIYQFLVSHQSSLLEAAPLRRCRESRQWGNLGAQSLLGVDVLADSVLGSERSP